MDKGFLECKGYYSDTCGRSCNTSITRILMFSALIPLRSPWRRLGVYKKFRHQKPPAINTDVTNHAVIHHSVQVEPADWTHKNSHGCRMCIKPGLQMLESRGMKTTQQGLLELFADWQLIWRPRTATVRRQKMSYFLLLLWNSKSTIIIFAAFCRSVGEMRKCCG